MKKQKQPKIRQPKIKEKNKYIFPNFLAMAMKNSNIETQLKASMFSIVLLLLGMILMGVYSILYLTQGWIFKGLVVMNIAAGFIFMTANLVTTYQQYVSYMAAVEVQNIMENKIVEKRKKNRLNQFLFFGGFILIVTGISLIFIITDYNWIGITVAVIGFLMAVSVFIRPKKKANKDDDKDNKLDVNTLDNNISPDNISLDTGQQIKQHLKKKEIIQQNQIKAMEQDLEEWKQQEELDQIESGASQYIDEAIPSQYDEQTDESQQQDQYTDYTQPFTPAPKRKFRGRDGRIYFS